MTKGTLSSWSAATMVCLSVVWAGCPNDTAGFCGDAFCAPSDGESCLSCAADCMCASCGDGACAPAIGESCTNCPGDCGGCGAVCGNGFCDAAENCGSCPGDCGSCGTTCGPTNCAGCCSGNTCLGGDATNACGGGGGICVDCGPDFVCNFGSCAVDGASRWSVVLDTVRFDPTDYSGAAWDFGSGPDPYIGVRAGSEASAVTYIDGPDDTLSITYVGANRVTNLRADALDAFLRFEVWDDDSPGDDGLCFFTYNAAEGSWFTGARQTATCVANAATMVSGMSLTWHLERF